MTWPEAPLDELVDIRIGRTPARANRAFWGEGTPWLSIADMNNGPELRVTREQITDGAVREVGGFLVAPGTVLLSFKLSIGKVGIAAVPMFTNEAIAALPVGNPKRLDAGYLAHALRALDFAAGANRAAMGKTLNKAALAELRIPLPPLDEQRRIARILDWVRAVTEARRRAIAALVRLPHAFLSAEASESTDGLPLRPLRFWLMEIRIGPFGSALHRADYVDNGIPLINPMHIVDGRLAPDPSYTVSVEKAAELSQYMLRSGDVVMGRRGEMGRCAVVTDNADGFICGTGSMILRADREVLQPIYLQAVLSSPHVKRALEKASLGATLPNLNKGIVGDLKVSIPTQRDQAAFAEVMQRTDSLLNVQRRQLLETENLAAALKARAFAGEL